MSYGGHPYGGVGYAGSNVDDIPADTQTTLAVEVSFTTDPLSTPVWVDITPDVRSWTSQRGRSRELERFQPGRATVVLSNLSAQYDSLNTGGPWFGNLKPMKRIRIRETFSGVTYPVFDGFVDKWQLNYPGKNKDATATVTATDAFKLFARTDLPLSVYHGVVLDDAPDVYWRFDESKNSFDDGTLDALNSGTLGTAGDATYVGPPEMGGEPLIVKDPGSSIVVTSSEINPGTLEMGAIKDDAGFRLLGGGTTSFVVEAWVKPTANTSVLNFVWEYIGSGPTGARVYGNPGAALFFQVNTTTTVYLATSANTPVGQRFHVVAQYISGQKARLWVNGALTESATATAGTIAADRPLRIGYREGDTNHDENWCGSISHVAIWRGAAAEAIDQTWVDRHYAAGTAPWQGDTIATRMGRVLDEVGWPALQRELDTGNVTLQSAELNVEALEHLQKAGETEYAGLFFISRDGTVRFDDRTAVLAREPYPVVYGDTAGQIGYVDFTPDDGDTAIRNRAVISRLNGVAKVAEDATSISEFGRFTYTLEGLLSDSEQDSIDYAAFVVDQYKDQRRRIVQLELTTPVTGQEAVAYPAMLGPELGDAISVENNPLGGIEFTQVCAIEGIEHSGEPKNALRTTRFILSPEYA